jgi:glycosyltransferase involved in cell wall biosynthesis
MRCLWVTLADPEPRHNGQFVYSGGLIDALAAAGAHVEVLGLARDNGAAEGRSDGKVRWWLAPHRPRSNWASLMSTLPNISDRCHTRDMTRMLGDLLRREEWSSIVFDGLSAGWAMKATLAAFSNGHKRPLLVYVSHNHEESVRAQIAQNQAPSLKRCVMRFESLKTTRLERAVVDAVDLVTAITPEDGALYRACRPDKRIEVLTPGYCGRNVAGRRITAELPRRAVIVGSFDWIAKRMNLEEFVQAADPLFAAAGAELRVVGSGEPAFLDRLRKTVSATEFTGTVASVTPHLEQARIAIVPERSGGGFKLKVLDYVFNRMPIVALDGSFAGVPLRHDESVILFPDHDALARGALEAMDDLPRLNRMQDCAYDVCHERFDWLARGRHLLSAMTVQ